MRMVVLPFHGIIPNSASRLCWGKRRERFGLSLSGQYRKRGTLAVPPGALPGLCPPVAAAAAGAESSLPPDWLTELGHSPGLTEQSHWKGPAIGQSHPRSREYPAEPPGSQTVLVLFHTKQRSRKCVYSVSGLLSTKDTAFVTCNSSYCHLPKDW